MITNAQIIIIHTLINALGWDNDLYRENLYMIFHKNSSKELSEKQAELFISNLEETAINAGVWKKYNNEKSELADRTGMATPAQVRKIEVLWKEIAYKKDQKFLKISLRKFLEKQFKISDVRFIEKIMVSKIIKSINIIKNKSKSVQSIVKN